MASSEFALFMGQLLRRPHQIVALAPSSAVLCAEMTRELDPTRGPVVELGAGTGSITKAILDAGIAPENCHSIEMNPGFCDRLRSRFPGLNVHQMSAGECGTLPLSGVQAVVSGLPLLSMSTKLQRDILSGFAKLVAPGGDYVQFTYGPKPPVTKAVRDELGLTWRKSHKIWWNMPPARVYRFSQE
ncbi:methyltransferase domain-containing protein [Gymnodinialimonas sp. 57CJ19]|uniref:class I SAM-dependent methyltransferase n=1 Tax=Gymnodinialimonas sp. 57CJ19 TaxID=3138498 RepID=UPI0031345B11